MSLQRRAFLPHRDDARSIAMVLAALAAMALQWAGILRHPLLHAATFPLAFIACVVNHNHQHCRTFGRRAWNDLFGALLSLATGQPASAIVPMHNLNHHVHSNTPLDHVRSTLVRLRWNLLNLLVFPFVAVAGYARVKRHEMARWRRSSPRLHRQLVRERAVLYPTLLILVLLGPLETLLYVIGPHLFGQWAIIAINLVQHDGCAQSDEYNQARNFVGRGLNWWLFNNGYHTAHHLRPGLHWSRLPAYHARIRGRIDPSLDCRSFFPTLFKLYIWPGERPARVREETP